MRREIKFVIPSKRSGAQTNRDRKGRGGIARRQGKVEITRRLRVHQVSVYRVLAEANPGQKRVVYGPGEGVVFTATTDRLCGLINR